MLFHYGCFFHPHQEVCYFYTKLHAKNRVAMKSPEKVIDHIVQWLNDYAENAKMNGFVVGVSGGIDSALTLNTVRKNRTPCDLS